MHRHARARALAKRRRKHDRPGEVEVEEVAGQAGKALAVHHVRLQRGHQPLLVRERDDGVARQRVERAALQRQQPQPAHLPQRAARA